MLQYVLIAVDARIPRLGGIPNLPLHAVKNLPGAKDLRAIRSTSAVIVVAPRREKDAFWESARANRYGTLEFPIWTEDIKQT